MNSRIFAFLLIVAVAFAISVTYVFLPQGHQASLVINHQTISVELATTTTAWERGLSGRSLLSPNTGMLFVFDHPDRWAIWMKDMHFALDIIWISADKKVVKIKENATPESYMSGEIFEPDQDVLYVVETPTGTVQSDGISLGQTVDFNNII